MQVISLKLLVLFSLLLSCSANQSQAQQDPRTENLNVAGFKAMIADKEVQLVDVRTTEEFVDGHLAEASNIDILEKDFMIKANELDKEVPVLVYCRSGGRSSRAAGILEEMGFTAIYNLEGGITAWVNEGEAITE